MTEKFTCLNYETIQAVAADTQVVRGLIFMGKEEA